MPHASLTTFLLLAAGCAAGDPPDETSPDTLSCMEDPDVAVASLTLDDDMHTVVIARWTSAVTERSRVTFTNGDGRDRVTAWESEPTTEHEHVLWGIVPETTISARVEVETSDGTTCGASAGADVGSLPDLTPVTSIDVLDGEEDARGITAALLRGPRDRWVVLYDEAGRTVWAWAVPPGLAEGTDLFRVRLAADGRSLEYMMQAMSADTVGTIVRLGFDGDAEPLVTVAGMHTDFVPLPAGGWGALGWELRDFADESGAERTFLGDTVLSITPEGVITETWNVFDEHTPDLNGTWGKGWYQPDPEAEDWSHVNSITWDEAEGDYLVTSTFNDGIFRINGATGAEVWSIGRSDAVVILPASSPSLLRAPHSVRITDDGLLAFNRGDGNSVPDGCSNAAEFSISGAVPAELFRYAPESCPHVYYLGESRRHDNGNTISVFSSAGFIEEVDPAGNVVMRLSLAGEMAYGYIDQL